MTRPPSGPQAWVAVLLAPLWWPYQAVSAAWWRHTQRRKAPGHRKDDQ
jgi:hypothetical protein